MNLMFSRWKMKIFPPAVDPGNLLKLVPPLPPEDNGRARSGDELAPDNVLTKLTDDYDPAPAEPYALSAAADEDEDARTCESVPVPEIVEMSADALELVNPLDELPWDLLAQGDFEGLAETGPDELYDQLIAADRSAFITIPPEIQERIESGAAETGDGSSGMFPDTESDGKDQEESREIEMPPPPPSGFEIVRSLNAVAQPSEVVTESEEEVTGSNRRRSERTRLSIPVRVVGYDRDGSEWSEVTETIDVSGTGLTLRLSKWTQHGLVMRLSLPLPEEFRTHAHGEPDFDVYAVVRRIESARNGTRVIGLEFLGEHPPECYSDAPWAAFHVKRPQGSDRRRRPREASSDVVWVEYLNESMECIAQEATRTENISSGGMRICAKAVPSGFEMVKISYANRAFESYAVVCNRYLGRDGMERLCLKFLDKDWYSGPGRQQVRALSDDEPSTANRKRRIVLADDDPPLRNVLSKILTQAGYDVTIAEDGRSAVEKTKRVNPDLVITDVLMPKMNGFQVCKAIKEFESPPKVILLSGVYSKPSYRAQARKEYGADDLLPKPFEVAVLLDRVKKHLAHLEPARL